MNLEVFDKVIRRIQDFPKPGVLFYDITSVFIHEKAFRFAVDMFCAWAKELDANSIVAVEARGFIFGAPVAEKLGLPLVLARKKGKLPGKIWCQDYSLEYGTDTICIQKSDLSPGSRVLLVDDLIATGGTFKATAKIIEKAQGARIVGFTAVIGLPFLGYEKLLSSAPIRTIINYNSE